ncbi:MAG TPA: hypothetical protein P5137_16850, partial [Candidatus Brocadiia bacterium]|nr:hypothetical protein [Candidatus Brocadiia bacterium]
GNAGWGTTLLSRLTGLGIDVDRANAGAAAGREAQAAFQNRTAFDAGRETEFVAIIERNVAAYRQIVAAQKAVADSIQDTTDRIKSAGEAFLEKYRTPEEKLAERQAAAARLLDKRDVLANPESYKLDDATLKRLNEISDPAQRAMQTQVELARKARDVEQERLRVIQDLHAARLAEGDAQIALLDKEKERFEAERRRTEEIRRQNASYAEQIALMSPAERARAKAVKEWVGEDYSRFGQLNESDKRRLMNDPSFKKVFEEKFQPRILAEQGIVQPAAAPERDWEAEKAAKAKAIKEQADAEATAGVAGVKAGQGEYAKQAKAVEEGMIAALAKWQKDNFKPGDKTAETKVDIGNIEILLKLDESGELTERISAAVRSAETLIVKHVMERVRLEHAANG